MDSPFKRSSPEVQFRLLCPAGRTGAIIGKGGAVIRLLQSITGAKIRVIDDIPIPCEERVVLIISPIPKAAGGKDIHAKRSEEGKEALEKNSGERKQEQGSDSAEPSTSKEGDAEDAWSPGQKALVRVLERIVKGDDAAYGGSVGDELDRRENDVCCRLLVGPGLMGCVLGRGGRTMEKIRQESCAIVRVSPKDHIPPCSYPGDELLQISGNLSTVKKALILVSSCLQERARIDAANSGGSTPYGEMAFPMRGHPPGFHPPDYHPRDYPPNALPEDVRGYNRMGIEEEVVYKLLCQADKVGSLIGKGGSVVRAIQNETGASIKVADPANDSDERVVVISSREVPDQRHFSAQDAVIRVHKRIAELGLEPGAAVVARLLVQSPHVRYLLGKGGHVINEMRKATGANIRVFQKEQSVKYGSPNDEIVQVTGNMQCVQDALYHVTSRLREAMLPMRPPVSNMAGPPPFYPPPFQEAPPPYRPQHYPPSPGSFQSPLPPQPHDHQLPSFSHGMDRIGPPNFDQPPFPYAGERYGHGPAFDRPPSPRSWTPQGASDGHQWVVGEPSCGNENQVVANSTVEVVIPQVYLTHVYGENSSHLNHIKQISGANVVVHEPKAGASEGLIVVSGTSDQARFAQTLIHAFILCGQA